MARTGSSRRSLMGFLDGFNPDRARGRRRLARRLPLSDGQSSSIVSGLVGAFRRAVYGDRRAALALGGGLSTRLSPRVEQLEDRRLLSVGAAYVDQVVGGYVIDGGYAGNWEVVVDHNELGKLDATDEVTWHGSSAPILGLVWGDSAFATIRPAIANTSDGGTVTVAPGDYPEALTISQSLTLIGDGVDSTVVNPSKPFGYALSVISPTADLTLEGMTVSNTGLGGISFVGDELTIEAARVQGGTFGISLSSGSLDVSHSWVSATSADPNHVGVFVSAGTTAVLHDNDLSTNVGQAISNDDPSAVVDASANWWGAGVDPGARVTGNVDYTPWLDSGNDSGGITANGFQGDYSSLTVSAAGEQTGGIGRIQEGVNLAADGGTVNVEAGTYTENVVVNKTVAIAGDTESPVELTGRITLQADADDVVIQDVTILANGSYMVHVGQAGVENLTLQDVTLDGQGVSIHAIHSSASEPLEGTVTLTNLTVEDMAIPDPSDPSDPFDAISVHVRLADGAGATLTGGTFTDLPGHVQFRGVGGSPTATVIIDDSHWTGGGSQGESALELFSLASVEITDSSMTAFVAAPMGNPVVGINAYDVGSLTISGMDIDLGNGMGQALTGGVGINLYGTISSVSLTDVDISHAGQAALMIPPASLGFAANIDAVVVDATSSLIGNGTATIQVGAFAGMPHGDVVVLNDASVTLAMDPTGMVIVEQGDVGWVTLSDADQHIDTDYVIVDDSFTYQSGQWFFFDSAVDTQDGWYQLNTNAFTTIQAAINAASASGTVSVEAGTYHERLNVNKSLTLLGAQAGVDATGRVALESIVTEAGLSTPNPDILIEVPLGVNGVTIDGFTLAGDPTNSTADTSTIRAWGNDLTVANNIISGWYGLIYKGGQNLTVDQNAFTVNKTGVAVQPLPAGNVAITYNSFLPGTSPATDAQAIYMTGVTGGDVSHNTATGFVGGAVKGSNNQGVDVDHPLTISGNTFTNNKAGVNLWGNTLFVDISGNDITGSTVVGISVKGQDIAITGNTITGSAASTGIAIERHVVDSVRITVEDNTVSGAAVGVAVTGATTGVVEVMLEDNDLTGNGVGLLVQGNALVDAGEGTLGSLGNNTLTGYTDGVVAGNYAIKNLNLTVAAGGTGIGVSARNNIFGPYVDPSVIENYLYDDTDDATRTAIDFGDAQGQVLEAPSTVYVDDSWAEVPLGADPDGVGVGLDVTMGVDAFATIGDALAAVDTTGLGGGTIYVSAGTYEGNAHVEKSNLAILGDPGDAAPGPGENAPLVDGQDLPGSGFFIGNGVHDVTIAGFEIANFTSDGNGVGNAISAWEDATDHITIRDNAMHDLGWDGVLVGNDGATGDHTYWTISGNVLEDYGAADIVDFSGYGLELTNASHGVIENNIITADTGGDANEPATGILVVARRNESDIVIRGNEFYGVMGIAIYVQAWDEETPNVTLDGVQIENNLIAATSLYGDVYVYDIGTGRITGVTLSENSLDSLTNYTLAAIDATGNWWGSASGPVNPGNTYNVLTQAGAVSGDAAFVRWLDSGDDDEPTTPGFQPAGSLFAPISNSEGEYYSSIQAAVDGTEAGGAILLGDGQYNESNITVPRSMTIGGQSEAGVVLGPGVADAGHANNAFDVQAANVTVENLTIDGNENGLLTGDNRFRSGVIGTTGADGLTVQNTTIQHIYRRGIQVSPDGAGGLSTGHYFYHNTVDDVELGPAITFFDGEGTISTNTISNTPRAIEVVQYYGPGSELVHVDDNIITGVTEEGIQLVWPAAGSTLNRNQITLGGGSVGAIGLLVRNASGAMTIEDNQVTGSQADAGIWLFGDGTVGSPVSIIDNILTTTDSAASVESGTAVGIFVSDDGRLFRDGDHNPVADMATYVTMTGNTISGFATGIELANTGVNPAGGKAIEATIGGAGAGDSNTITGTAGATGVSIHGALASADVLGNDIADNAIGIRIVDGSDATVTGNDFSDNSDKQFEGDASTLGLTAGILVGNTFDRAVTVGTSVDPADITVPAIFSTIQGGVDAATAGDTVNVAAGTYDENVTVGESIHLIGEDRETTTIQPSTATGLNANNAIVEIAGSGVSVELAGLTIDGQYVKPVGSGVYDLVGVFVHDSATANVHDNRITSITDIPFSGKQTGFAVAVGKLSVSSATATVQGNVIDTYQKGGILAVGAATNVTIGGTEPGQANTITGVGATTAIAQNGIQLTAGATGTIVGNTIEDNGYVGSTWGSSAILLGSSNGTRAGDGIVVSGNAIDGNDIGVWVTVDGTVTIEHNTITHVTGGGAGIGFSQGTADVCYNLIDTAGSGMGNMTLQIAPFHSTVPTVVNLTGNILRGSDDGIVIADLGAGDPTVVAHYNEITGATNQAIFCANLGGNGIGTQQDFSANYFGATDDATLTALIVGDGVAMVDVTPVLNNGDADSIDDNGFQADLSELTVTAMFGQTGSTGRIQEAIDLVSGSTVYVNAGTYEEVVDIDTSVTLLGAKHGQDARSRDTSTGETIINPGFSDGNLGTFRVNADNVTIDGFEFANTTVAIQALKQDGAANVVVRNNYVVNASVDGINFWRAASGTIEQNLIENVGTSGITAGDDRGTSATGDDVATVATIRNNEVVNARFGITGYLVDSQIAGNLVRDYLFDDGAGIGGQFVGVTIGGFDEEDEIDPLQANEVRGYTFSVGMAFAPAANRPVSSGLTVVGNTVSENGLGVLLLQDAAGLFTEFSGNAIDVSPFGLAAIAHAGSDTWDLSAAVDNTINGIATSDPDLADQFALENMILHKIDGPAFAVPPLSATGTAGLVLLVADNVYVTPESYSASFMGTTGPSIQRGINAAGEEWTVNVAPGTYTGALLINRSLTLAGADEDTTIVDVDVTTGITNQSGVEVTADDVTLSGFTVQGSSANSAVRYGVDCGADGLSISDVTVQGMYRSGFNFNGAMNLTLDGVSAFDNVGSGIGLGDVVGAHLSNVTTSGNGWNAVSVMTWGRYHELGTDDIVIDGTNSFGEVATANGALQLEAGNWNDPNNVVPITWSTLAADNAQVTIQAADFGYALGGPQAQEPYSHSGTTLWHDYIRTRFYDTLEHALSAAEGSPDHFLPHDRFIRTTNGLAQQTVYEVYDLDGDTMSIQAAIDDSKDGDTIHVTSGTYLGNVNATGKSFTLDVGDSPAQVTIDGDLTLSAGVTLIEELDGSSPGAGYDQLVVLGEVNLDGALVVIRSFNPAVGESFTIIDNDEAEDVVGQFAGLDQGATITVNGIPLVISYEGGDGNDVTLTLERPEEVWANDTWVEDVNVAGGTVGVLEPGDIVDSNPALGDADVQDKIYGVNAFSAIQDGIVAVADGGTVNVLSGMYSEQLTITKSLSLIGAGEESTMVVAPPANRANSVTHDGTVYDYMLAAYATAGTIDVRVEGFTFDANGENKSAGTARFAGIFLRDVKEVVESTGGVYASTVENFAVTPEYESWGIRVFGDSALTIDDVDVSGHTRDGIVVNGDDGPGADPVVSVSNSEVTGSATGLNGIQFGYGAAGAITGNTVTGQSRSTSYAGVGIYVYDSDGVEVTGNNVSGNHYGIFVQASTGVDVSGNVVDDNLALGIQLSDADGNTVSGNTITGTLGSEDKAIGLNNGSTGNLIDDNEITLPTAGTGLLYAMHLEGGSGANTIQFNTITGGKRGVQVDGGNDGVTTTIEGNTITGSTFAGIFFTSGVGDISGNTIEITDGTALAGIAVSGGSGGTDIDDNTVTLPTSGTGLLYAVWFTGADTGNKTIENNTITGGARAIQFDGGPGHSGTNVITGNTIAGASFGGIMSFCFGNFVITGNDVTGTDRPMEFQQGGQGDITISGNRIVSTAYDAINAGGYASMTVSGNSIELTTGGLPLNNRVGGTLIDASGNWWNTNDATTLGNWMALSVGPIDYTPWLDTDTDGDGGAPGFVGDFSYLHVDNDSPNTTTDGYINEALALVDGSTILVHSGTYNETILFGTTYDKAGVRIIGDAANRPEITAGVRFINTQPIDGISLESLVLSGDDPADNKNAVITIQHNTAAVNAFSLIDSVVDGGNVSGRHGLIGNLMGGSLTVTGTEFVDILGWSLLDIDTSSDYSPYGGNGLPLGSITFSGNYVHDSNGSISLRGHYPDKTGTVTVENNRVTNIGGNEDAQGQHWAAIEINHAVNVTIANNEITQVHLGEWGEGQALQLWDIDTVDIHNNILADNYQGIWIFGGETGGAYGGPWAIPSGSIYDNDFSGNADYALKIEGTATGAVLDAESNWWGSPDGPTNDGNTYNVPTQGALVGDRVDYVRWLDSGVDTEPETLGFQPVGSLFAPVWNDEGEYYSSIQAAVNGTDAGGTVYVGEGTYRESNIVVDHALTIDGAGQEVVTIVPAAEDDNLTSPTDGVTQYGLVIQSDDVTVRDVTFDGQGNEDLTAGKSNYRIGIYNPARSNTHVDHVSVLNTYVYGINFESVSGASHEVTWSIIENVVYKNGIRSRGTGDYSHNEIRNASGGIYVGWYTGSDPVTINYNTIENIAGTADSYYGPLDEGYGWIPEGIYQYRQNTDATVFVIGNTMSGFGDSGRGIRLYNTDADSIVSDNTMHFETGGADNMGVFLGGSAGTTISGNHIYLDGADLGILVGRGVSGVPVPNVISGNTIISTASTSAALPQGVGIAISNRPDWDPTLNETIYDTDTTITGNTITGLAYGVVIDSDPATGYTNHATIDGDNEISGGGTGILVRGGGAVATITGNSASIHGNAIGIDVDGGTAAITDNHIFDNTTAGIRVLGGGTITDLAGNDFDDGAPGDGADDNATDLLLAASAGTVTFGADNAFAGDAFFIDNQSDVDYDLEDTGNTFDETDDFRIEDKMHHQLDDDNLGEGVITWVDDTLFVTDGGTDHSIQRGINTASPGWIVNVEAGDYAENITVDKALTLAGAQANVDPRESLGGRSGPESVIDGSGGATAVAIAAADVTINGFTITKAQTQAITGSTNASILYNKFLEDGWNSNYAYVYNTRGVSSVVFQYNDVVADESRAHGVNYGYYAWGNTDGNLVYDNDFRGLFGNAIYIKGYDYHVSVNNEVTANDISGTNAAMQLESLASTTVANNNLHGNEYGLYLWGRYAGSFENVSITNNFVTDNTKGVYLKAGTYGDLSTFALNANSISGNTEYGFNNSSGVSVDASGNWWGSVNGPDTALNTWAGTPKGDAVIGEAIIAPWLTDGTDYNSHTTPPDYPPVLPGFQPGDLDTIPPAVSGPDLVDASDSGYLDYDDITNDDTPEFTGTAELGATVDLMEGDTLLGTAMADLITGEWTITSTELDDGDHVLFARATDQAGNASPSGTLTVSIDTEAPVPDAGADQNVHEGDLVTLIGDFDDPNPGYEPYAELWHLESSTNPQPVPDAAGDTLSFTPVDQGTYVFSYTVTDAAGNVAADDVTVNVLNAAPVIETLGVTTTPVAEGQSTTLDGTYSDAGVSDTHQLDIDWDGDGVYDQTVAVTDGSFSVEHLYADDNPTGTPSDTFSINVRLRDNAGDADTGSVAMTVDNLAPTVALDAVSAVYESGNVAYGKSIIGGSGYWNYASYYGGGTYNPQHATDSYSGSITEVVGNYWLGKQGVSTGYFVLDLGSPVAMDQIVLFNTRNGAVGDRYTGSFRIVASNSIVDQGSELGYNLSGGTVIASGTLTRQGSTTLVPDTFALTDHTAYRYVRFDALNGYYEGVGLNEIRIYTSPATLNGTITDAGTLDTFTLDLDWGDPLSPNDTQSFSLGTTPLTKAANGIDWNPTTRAFSVDHAYLDDNPTATASDVYSISATVTDDDGMSGGDSTTVEVNNLPPAVALDPVAAIDEDGAATLAGTIADAGSLDTFTLDLNWGDPLSPGNTQSFELGNTALTKAANGIDWNPTTRAFSVDHEYLDDNPTATASDVYTISATVTDDDGGASAADTTTVAVNNLTPAVALDSVVAIDENGVATLSVTITDEGTLDTFTLDIDWGDPLSPGNIEQYTYAASATGSQTFTLTHQYLDDNPTATASDVYTISATVTDDDGATSTEGTTTVEVNNLTPAVALDPVVAIDENGVATLTGTITDTGTLDTFTLDIDWGDPDSPNNIEQYTYAASATGSQTFTLTHQYLDDNPSVTPSDVYTITATVTDDDGGTSTEDTTTVQVNNVAPAISIVGAPATSPEGTEIDLSVSIVDPGTADSYTYAWSVTKGGVAYGDDGTDPTFSFTPDDDAEYVVTLAVTDDDGGHDTTTATIEVTDVAPTIALSGDAVTNEGAWYTLTLGAVTEPGDDPVVAYVVYWGDGTFDAYDSISPKQHYYDDNVYDGAPVGPISVTLIEQAPGEDPVAHMGAGQLNLTVNNVAPTAVVLNNGPRNEGSTGTVYVTLPNDVSAADRAAGYTYGYDFNNDGDFADPGEIASTASDSAIVPATYLNDDPSRTVRVEIRDKDGGARSYTTIIAVNNVAPIIDAGPDGQAFVDAAFTRTGTITDPGTDVWTGSVNYGDGSGDLPLTVVGKTFLLDHVYAIADTYTINVTLDDGDEGEDTDTLQVVVIEDTLRVVDFADNASGFDVQFSRAIDLGALNLYATDDYGLDLADVKVIKDEGEPTEERIDGSLVWDADTNTLSFVKTGGVLAAGDYSVILVSAADAIVDPDGAELDGNGDGTGGDDYETSFTVGSGSARVVSMPDFTRGAGQPVDVPATDAGLPIRISDGTGVNGIDFELVFDPALLTITGAALGADVPTGWTVTINDEDADAGLILFSVYGQTALTGTNLEILVLTADVPTTAGYRDSQVIGIDQLRLNDGAIASKADRAVHVAAYFGDADGGGIPSGGGSPYLAYDAALISRVAVELDSGFAGYPLIDPVIIADVSGEGLVGSLDAAFVARKANELEQPQIPDVPDLSGKGSGEGSAAPALAASSSSGQDGGAAMAETSSPSRTGGRTVGPVQRPADSSRTLLSGPREGARRTAVDAAMADDPAGFDRGMLYAAGWVENQARNRAKGKDRPDQVDDVFAMYGSGQEGI